MDGGEATAGQCAALNFQDRDVPLAIQSSQRNDPTNIWHPVHILLNLSKNQGSAVCAGNSRQGFGTSLSSFNEIRFVVNRRRRLFDLRLIRAGEGHRDPWAPSS